MTGWLGLLGLAGGLAFVVVWLAMPLAIRVWRALGRQDREISLRKVHTGEIPRVGGFVVMVGFAVVAIRGLAGTTELSATHEWFAFNSLTGAVLGALLCGAVGLYDDLVGMRARYKLLGQIVAATIAVVGFGVHWTALATLLGPAEVLAGPLTIAFLVAGVNAINLSDGLDGLAAGNVAIGCGVVLLAALSHGADAVALGWIAATAVGAVLGFLIHNRHPARVFMGDTGSYFLGFLVTALLLHVEPVRERVAIIQVSIPLLALALPLFDLGLAVVRRSVRGQPISAPDCDHIHHRLLGQGLPHGRAVLVLWASAALFAGLAYLNVIGVGGWWTLTGAALGVLIVAVVLGYHNMLRSLPAFTGDHVLGLRDRRRQMTELLAAIDGLAAGVTDTGEARWQRLAPGIAPVLARLGVPGFEVRRGTQVILRAGEDTTAWAWLSLPLPGAEAAELRLALAVRLPELQPEHLLLLERVVVQLAGASPARR